MRRFWIALLAVALEVVVALPAGAKKPDKSDRPDTGFKPMACAVDDGFAFVSALVTDAKHTNQYVLADDSGLFTLTATEAGGFNETRYTVEPESGYLPITSVDDVLCVEVTRTSGTLSDLRVRWLGCQDCGLYRATGEGPEELQQRWCGLLCRRQRRGLDRHRRGEDGCCHAEHQERTCNDDGEDRDRQIRDLNSGDTR